MTLSPESRYATLIDSVMPPRHQGLVWHYTDAGAVLGILETGRIWASSMVMTNDPEDLLHGLNIIRTKSESHLEQHPSEDVIRAWIVAAAAKIEAFERADSYIVCGSTIGDSHPQFLLYGPYAIGINGAMQLEKVERSQRPVGSSQWGGRFETGWRPVRYSAADKSRHVASLMNALHSLANRQPQVGIDSDPDVYEAAIECVVRSCAYMKHESFAHEREVRLYGRAAMTNSQVLLRSGRYGISPYLEIRLSEGQPNRGGDFPLQEINLGPGLTQPTAAEAGLRIALNEKGYGSVRVKDLSGDRRI